MEKQRDIYRKSIAILFKANFDSALFEEKHDEMMKDSDFNAIRDDVEDEYFTKNRGISAYIKAIQYLCAKIEACTAENTLFAAVEDYIIAKENIGITKIAKAPVEVQSEAVVKIKRKKRQTKAVAVKNAQSENPPVHLDCKSPQTCKKCRIMRRLNPSSKPRKLNVKKEKKISPKQSKSEPPKPETNAVANNSPSTLQNNGPSANQSEQCKPGHQLPYLDHQYSRISFYGSGEDSSKEQPDKINDKKEMVSLNNTIPKIWTGDVSSGSILKAKVTPIPVQKPKPVFRFKPNNGLQQPAPAYYISSLMPAAPSIQPPTIVRSIRQVNQSIFATSTVPLQFRSPVNVLQGTVMRQPIYCIRFVHPAQQHQSNNRS